MEIDSEKRLFEDNKPLDVRITSVNITNEDWDFCKKHKLKFTTLLQERIAQLKAIDSGAIVENVQEERRKKEAFIDLADKMKNFIDKKGLLDEYLKE